MSEKKKITLKELKEKTQGFSIEKLENILYQLDTKQEENGVMTTKRTYLVKAILKQRNDLQKNVKNAHYNRGSQLEILVATQLYKQDLETYIVDNKSGIDWTGAFGHKYECKSMTVDNHSSGYRTMAQWQELGTNKNMVLVFENLVFQATKTQWLELMDLLQFKADKTKKGLEYRIKGTKKNYQVVRDNCTFKGYLDLTV